MTPVQRPFDSRSLAQGGPPTRKAFTLLEMLIVIGIITLLAAILVPVISQVRMRAFVAQTQGEMQRIMTACQSYYHDFNAYPGPLATNMIATTGNAVVSSGIQNEPQGVTVVPGFNPAAITSSENLVLGLVGLLNPWPASVPLPPYYMPPPPKHDVMSLNYSRPVSYHYIDFLPEEIPNPVGLAYYGYGTDGVTPPAPPTQTDALQRPVHDSVVPEFIDHIPTPMPILYMRATPGSKAITAAGPTNPAGDLVAYDYTQLDPYGFEKPKAGDFPAPTGVIENNNGWDVYLMNPSILNEPRGKNAFILIDAGPDRLFGTKDDIIVTP